jgi:hypothetical protein
MVVFNGNIWEICYQNVVTNGTVSTIPSGQQQTLRQQELLANCQQP